MLRFASSVDDDGDSNDDDDENVSLSKNGNFISKRFLRMKIVSMSFHFAIGQILLIFTASSDSDN